MHHPIDWLSDIERSNIRSSLQSSVDVIASGHLHEASVEIVRSVDGDTVHLVAGAAYQTRKWPNRAMYVTFDGANLEIFATGLRNPQELAFDQYCNLWTGDNNSDGGDPARWVYVVENGDSGWRVGYQFITQPNSRGPWLAERHCYPYFEGQAAFLLPPLANIGNGPSGLSYHPGTDSTSAIGTGSSSAISAAAPAAASIASA